MIKKNTRWKCKKYTDWVKTLDSCVSMRPSDDPHHIQGVLPGGMSTKLHDLFTIPLVRDEHGEFNQKGAKQWEKDNDISQAVEVLRIIDRAINEGLIEIRWVGEC